MSVNFRSTILLARKTATGLPVPPEAVAALGPGKRHAVVVTVGDYSYRSTVASMDGTFMIPFSAEHRSASGFAAGDEVEVTLTLDTAPRVVEVPADLAAALDANPQAKQAFEAMSYSHQRQHVLAVEAAKTEPTRVKRVAKAIEMLTANQR